jgi:hypothetical protein
MNAIPLLSLLTDIVASFGADSVALGFRACHWQKTTPVSCTRDVVADGSALGCKVPPHTNEFFESWFDDEQP